MGSVSKRRLKDGRIRYRARWRDPAGRPKERRFELKRDADRFLAQIESDKALGKYVDPRAGSIPLGDYLHRWHHARFHIRPTTRSRDGSLIQGHIVPALGRMPLNGVRPSHLRSWIQSLLDGGLSPATVNKIRSIVSSAMESAVQDGLIGANPVRAVKPVRAIRPEMRILEPSEIAALLDALPKRYVNLACVAVFAGLRSGEARGLRIRDFDALRRVILVRRTVVEVGGKLSFSEPKTRSSVRSITLPRFVVDGLAEHIRLYGTGEGGLLFTSDSGHPIRKDNFRRRVWDPAVSASVGGTLRFHDLRHTHAALLIADGVHAKVIQDRLGHKSITTTLDLYGHLMPGLEEAVADGLDRQFGDGDVGRTRAPGAARGL